MEPDTARGAQLARPALLPIFVVQLVVLVLAAGCCWLIDPVKAYSTLLGGVIAIGPNGYFTRWAFRYSGAQSAGSVAQSFYRGEAGKFLLTTVSFAAVFILIKPLDIVVLFLSYIFFMALNWILALRVLKL